MRRIFSFVTMTLDGYYEGPNQEFDWPIVDTEFNEFSIGQLDEVSTLLFGRVTYEGMAAYWTTPEALEGDPEIAPRMNGIAKIVVSRTLDRADWANTRLVKDIGELGRLKGVPGRDIAIFGSSSLTVSLIEAGLVDEIRVMVNPVVLGGGRSLFGNAPERVHLNLLEARPFRSGNVLLRYEPVPR